MKAYGIPRKSSLQYPAKQDILEFAMPSRAGKQNSRNKARSPHSVQES